MTNFYKERRKHKKITTQAEAERKAPGITEQEKKEFESLKRAMAGAGQGDRRRTISLEREQVGELAGLIHQPKSLVFPLTVQFKDDKGICHSEYTIVPPDESKKVNIFVRIKKKINNNSNNCYG